VQTINSDKTAVEGNHNSTKKQKKEMKK